MSSIQAKPSSSSPKSWAQRGEVTAVRLSVLGVMLGCGTSHVSAPAASAPAVVTQPAPPEPVEAGAPAPPAPSPAATCTLLGLDAVLRCDEAPTAGDALLASACAARGTADAAITLHRLCSAAQQRERYAEAFAFCNGVVRSAPDSDTAGYAAGMALEALGMQGRVCGTELSAHATAYHGALCHDAGATRWRSECEIFAMVPCIVLRSEASRSLYDGEYAKASTDYERLAHDPVCSKLRWADESLYNAALSAQKAGDTARAQQFFDELRRRFPTSPLALRAGAASPSPPTQGP